MTSISVDTAYQLARQRHEELAQAAALARAAHSARQASRWQVLELLRRIARSVPPGPRSGRTLHQIRPADPSSASMSRRTTDSAVCRDAQTSPAA